MVEDNEDVRDLLALLLIARGWCVETAANASQALPLLLEHNYDLVLCDIRLPGVNAATLYEQVRAERPEIAQRFLLCTGDNLSEETENFIRSSGLPVLTKPFRADDLIQACVAFMRRWVTSTI